MPTRKQKKLLAMPAAPPPQHPFDQIHGVDTSGLIALWRATNPPHPISRYTFIDFGAGKGRAMLVASELPFHQVIGIELNPTLADIAQLNLDHWLSTHAADTTAPPLAPIRLYEQDALTFDLPRTPTLAFLFHPFEAPVLKLLLRHIEARFAKKSGTPPPAFDLLYVNAECRRVLDLNPAFTRLFFGPVAMSPKHHAADIAAIAQQKDYGSTGDEKCAIYRYTGRSAKLT